MRLIASKFGLPDIDFTKLLPSGNQSMHAMDYVIVGAGVGDVFLLAAIEWGNIAVGITVVGTAAATLVYKAAVKLTPMLKEWGMWKLAKTRREFAQFKAESLARSASKDERIAILERRLDSMENERAELFDAMQVTIKSRIIDAGVRPQTVTTIQLTPPIESDHHP